MTWLVNYAGDDAGASAAEYALILAFIALVIIASISLFGASLNSLFNGEANNFSSL
jgi:pilus assembly protein Flp/PilA